MTKIEDVLVENMEIKFNYELYTNLKYNLNDINREISSNDISYMIRYITFGNNMSEYTLKLERDSELDKLYSSKIKNLIKLYAETKIKELQEYFKLKGISLE